MKKFRIHAHMRVDLYKVIEAETLEEAQEKSEQYAIDGTMEEDPENDGEFMWDTALDREIKDDVK